ncbi:hypothetical protein WK94_24310 [Burkholderia ubonensis]|uniref:hypothetical protein n=1 Tax=Burkholderia ubonensis TaxID=101571 RepID=UPI00075F121D|nr:hypothetical protein [Burkholderia ubonensis]KVW39458.1 hypothetical protein WK94_24310 [Burkholderia ubonensis]
MSIQSYDIQIPAGGAQTLEAGGQIFDFLSSDSAFDQIQVLPEFQQGNVTLRLGQGFDAGAIVNRWYIKNPGTTAINGTVVLSTAGFRNFRISGDVNVLDGGKSRTLSGAAFIGVGYNAAIASQYSGIALKNAVGTGVRLVVEQYTLATLSTAGGIVQMKLGPVANVAAYATAGSVASKLAGGAVGSGTVVSGSGAAVVAGMSQLNFITLNQQMPTYNEPLREPIVIPPGYCLLAQCATQAYDVGCDFEWYEEPNT